MCKEREKGGKKTIELDGMNRWCKNECKWVKMNNARKMQNATNVLNELETSSFCVGTLTKFI